MTKSNKNVVQDTFEQVYNCVLSNLGTSRALSLAIAKRTGSLMHNTHLFDIDPKNYDVPHAYWADAQSVALFKKSLLIKEGKTQEELHSESIVRFFELEEINRRTNLTIPFLKSFQDVSLICEVQRIIKDVLGVSLPRCIFTPQFGKGSTYMLPADESTIGHKLENIFDATPHAALYFQEVYSSSPHIFSNMKYDNDSLYKGTLYYQVQGNRFSSVAKDFRKRRPISVEPVFNMLLQKNIGNFIRHRLKRVGIDIESQQEFHKFLLMNFNDMYSTIDQSDASDRISHSLIKLLLPPDWYTYLNRIRSRKTEILEGIWIELEKFASQGNGFIFELETLLFYAIAQATINLTGQGKKHLVSAYGDDVIVPEQFFDAVVSSYELFGFSINTEKSYHKGNFKESCGVDIFKGENVRPYFLKEFSNGTAGIYEAANFIARLASRSVNHYGYDRSYYSIWFRFISLLPEHHRYGGPENLGDNVLHGYRWKTRWKGSIRCISGIRRKYQLSDFYLPRGKNSLLAYVYCGYKSEGLLKRNARFTTVKTEYVCYGQLKDWL